MAGYSKFLVTGNKDNLISCARWPVNYRGLRSSKTSNPGANYEFIDKQSLAFNKCGSSRCLTCPMADPSNLTFQHSKNTFCKVFNCVYMLKCGNCPMSYIGQTSNNLHLRINVHRDHIKKNVCKDNDRKVEYDHFKLHDFTQAKIHILHIQKDSKRRLFIENIFMARRRTVYPYGLNQIFNHSNYYNNCCKDNYNENVYSLFPTHTKLNKRFKRGNRTNTKPNFNIRQIFQQFNKFFHNFDFNKIKNIVFALKFKQIDMLLAHIDKINIKSQLHHLLKDLLIHRANYIGHNIMQTKPKKIENYSYCVFNYTNKNINSLNINNIFNKASSLFPINNTKVKSAFKYEQSIGRLIYNYNNTSKEFKGTDQEILNAKCICDDPNYLQYVNKDYGHIITGNIEIVQDKQLLDIMKQGTNYRFKGFKTKKSILNGLYTDIDNFIYKISSKYKIPMGFFIEWKEFVLQQLQNNLKSPKPQQHQHTKDLRQSIKKLQDVFVITYVDKAASNFAFTCKKFYMQNLIAAFNNTNLFQKENSKQATVSKRIIALYKRIKNKPDNLNYPYIVLVPKLHKTPVTFRTVTMGHKTYNAKASKLLLKELQKMETYITANKNHVFVKNSLELKNIIKDFTNIVSISTYDFKDMFNKIQLDSIFQTLSNLYIEFNDKVKFTYEATEFNYLLQMVIYHNYVIFGGKIYKQTVGLPQGLASSNSASNLYLHHYESTHWKQKDNTHLYRYIDDIFSIKFDDTTTDFDFYPSSLSLIKTSLDNQATFLDLKINISNKKLNFNINKKQQQLNFKIVQMQNYKSNLHERVFENIIYNTLLRINNLCSTRFKEQNYSEVRELAVDYNYPDKLISKMHSKLVHRIKCQNTS